MSLLKELNDSHITIRAISLSLFLLPFWYISIYLFGNEFYVLSGNIVVLSLCLVICITSSALFYVFCFKTTDFEKTTNNALISNMTIAVVFLSLWISTLIFIIYSIDFLFNRKIYFYWFIVIYYAPILILNFLLLVFGNQKKEQHKQK